MSVGRSSILPSCMSFGWTKRMSSSMPELLEQRGADETVEIGAGDESVTGRGRGHDPESRQLAPDPLAVRQVRASQAEAAEHEQRLARPASRGSGRTPSCDAGAVGVEERADAPQHVRVGRAARRRDGVDDDEAPGRRQALELAAVGGDELAPASATWRPLVIRGPVRSTRASGNAAHRRSACAASSPRAGQRLGRAGPRSGRRRRTSGANAAGSLRGQAASKRVEELVVGHCRTRAGPRRASTPRRRAGAGCARRRGPARPASTARRIARAIATGSSARRDRAGAQDRVAAELHRQRGVATRCRRRRRGSPGRSACSTMSAQVVRVADAHAAADRRAERHDRRAADVLEAAREHRVVGRVRQDGEAVVDELLGGDQQLGRVGQQRALVADDLELDPVGRERLAGELAR